MQFRKSSFGRFYCLFFFFVLRKRLGLKMISCGGHTKSAVWKKVLGVGLLVLTVLTVRCEGGKEPVQDLFSFGYGPTDVSKSLRLHVDSVVGAQTTTQCLTVS